MITLFADQQRVVRETAKTFAQGHRVVVLQCPTGFGKTTVASWMIQRRLQQGDRVLFLAHLDTLIEDTAARLRASGLRVGVIQANKTADDDAPVQVATTQTLAARNRRPPADFVILDEAHRVMGATVRQILADYPSTPRVLLLTATPQRGDGQPLGDIATAMVAGPSVRSLINSQRLVQPVVIAPDVPRKGLACSPLDAYRRWSPRGTAIVFCSTVAHANQTAAEFESAGISSVVIVGDTKRAVRDSIRQRVTAGEVRVLVGVAVFLEGFDLPAVDTVILARPFSVVGAFLQAIGRGLRVAPNKRTCTVIDLAGSALVHGLPDEERQWSLTGEAVLRADASVPLRRCREITCGAVFAPAARCPRCGAPAVSSTVLPRVLNAGEKLRVLDQVPLWQRDRAYLATLYGVASNRMRMDHDRATRWAEQQFRKARGRDPVLNKPENATTQPRLRGVA